MNLPLIQSCEGCGACCMGMNSPPFIGRDDPELLAAPLDVHKSYEDGMVQRDRDGWPDFVPCFWLDLETRKCKHYEHRPEVCRDALVINDDGCRHWREEYKID